MVTELPVRIEFSLPDGWQAAPPDEVGAPGIAFVALHPDPGGANGFVANLTIAGELREPAVPMATIADESVRRLESVAESVLVRDRAEFDSGAAPGMTQVVELAMADGKRLLQTQVHLPMVNSLGQRAVLELVLTCTPEQLADVRGGFEEFVGTVRPAKAGA
jgi:hypothetical protein